MKKLLLIVGCAAVALAGCATRQVMTEEVRNVPCLPGITRHDAKHARLKSILGIDDAVLADTNRFVLGVGDYSQVFKFDEPFCGFVNARVYLDTMEDPRLRTTDGKPHRLRSVELTRRLPSASKEADILAEFQTSCDFVAEILGIEPPQARLIIDVDKWRKGLGEALYLLDGITSTMVFALADGQRIAVRLTEPLYAVRNGKMVMARPGLVKIDLTFNPSLMHHGRHRPIGEKTPVEKEIDFGPDCRDKLAKALKDGIERRSRARKIVP